MLLFEAFGDDSEEAFKRLDRVFRNVEMACQRTSDKLSHGLTKAVPFGGTN